MTKIVTHEAEIKYGVVKSYAVYSEMTIIKLERNNSEQEYKLTKSVSLLHIGDIIGIVKDKKLNEFVSYFRCSGSKDEPWADIVGVEPGLF